MPSTVSEFVAPLLTRPEETYTISFAGVPPGTYEAYCVPHLALGMKMSITVTPVGARSDAIRSLRSQAPAATPPSRSVATSTSLASAGVTDVAKSGEGSATKGKQDYFEFQVEKPAAEADGNPAPQYPEALRSSGVEGEVDVQFVVDVNGRADMNTFSVLKATNDLFALAVRNTMPLMHYYPAILHGQPVRQVVQQAFMFNINH